MASKRNPSQSDSDEFEYQYGCTVSFQLRQHILTIKKSSRKVSKKLSPTLSHGRSAAIWLRKSFVRPYF